MTNDFGGRGSFSRRRLRQRLGVAMGVAAVGVMGLQPLPSHAEEVPPNVMFLMDNNESMQDFPQPLPEVGDTSVWGCSDFALVSAMSWFDKDSPDVTKNGSVVYDPDGDFAADIGSTEPQFF